jgi:hypothetical protein
MVQAVFRMLCGLVRRVLTTNPILLTPSLRLPFSAGCEFARSHSPPDCRLPELLTRYPALRRDLAVATPCCRAQRAVRPARAKLAFPVARLTPLYLATTISVDMYVDLLSIYRHCRNEPSRIFSDLSLSGLTSTFRHKCRRAQRHDSSGAALPILMLS